MGAGQRPLPELMEKGRPSRYAALSMRVRISLTSHAAIRGPNRLSGFGNLPDLMPAHHVDREIGIKVKMVGNRMKPDWGSPSWAAGSPSVPAFVPACQQFLSDSIGL